MVLNRVHLLELGHVRRAVATCLACRFGNLATVLRGVCVALSDEICLDFGSLLSKFHHHSLRITAKASIGGVARDLEREIGCRYPYL